MLTPYLAFGVLNRPKEQDMRHVVMAEMVGSVFEVVAGAGDVVEPTDTLVILESMKMEIPVIVEVDGTVSKIAVEEGTVVQEGDLIAEIS
jgi:biotin carboxyl carrier protein